SALSRALIPDAPSISRDHDVATPQPSGDTIPIPVTTTRLMTTLTRERNVEGHQRILNSDQFFDDHFRAQVLLT
mgnify:CR=1